MVSGTKKKWKTIQNFCIIVKAIQLLFNKGKYKFLCVKTVNLKEKVTMSNGLR